MAALFLTTLAAVLALSAADPVVELREPTPSTIEVATAQSGMGTAPSTYQLPEPQRDLAPRGIRCGLSIWAANSQFVSATVRHVAGEGTVERLAKHAELCKVTTTTPSLRGSMPPGTYELDDCCTSDRLHDNLLKLHSDEVKEAMSNIFVHLMTWFKKEEGVDFSLDPKEFGMDFPGLTSVQLSNETDQTDPFGEALMSALDEDEEEGEGVQRVRPVDVMDQVVDQLDAEAATAQAKLEALESQAEEDASSVQETMVVDINGKYSYAPAHEILQDDAGDNAKTSEDEDDDLGDASEDSDAAEEEEEGEKQDEEAEEKSEEDDEDEKGPSDELASDVEGQEEEEENEGDAEGDE